MKHGIKILALKTLAYILLTLTLTTEAELPLRYLPTFHHNIKTP
jgi:hypothetical protein